MTENTVKYSENGFWIKKEADKYIVGLSEKGQDDLGEVSFIELPETGVIKTTDTLIGVEAGVLVEAFPGQIIVVPTAGSQQVFSSGYLTVYFGRKR